MRWSIFLIIALTIAVAVSSFMVVSKLQTFLEHQPTIDVNSVDLITRRRSETDIKPITKYRVRTGSDPDIYDGIKTDLDLNQYSNKDNSNSAHSEGAGSRRNSDGSLKKPVEQTIVNPESNVNSNPGSGDFILTN